MAQIITNGVFINGRPSFASNSEYPLILKDTQTLTANNTTVNVPLYRIVGTIEVFWIMGIVTTALSSNITGALFRVNDQTVQTSLSSAATLSSFGANSLLFKSDSNSTINGTDATTNPSIKEVYAGGVGVLTGQSVVIISKSGANTDIEFRYATTNTPASGVIDFYLFYRLIDNTSTVTAQ